MLIAIRNIQDLTASDSMLAKIMQEEQNLKSQKRIQDNSLDHATAQRIQKEEEKKMEAEEFKRLQVRKQHDTFLSLQMFET